MAANDTLGLNQVFQIYNEDGSEYEGLVMHKSATDSVVMSLGDSITGDVYWINNELELTMHEYITYNGVNYVLVNPPTIVREGMVSDNSELKGMTKYSFKFYHPMYQLGNFPFSDVAVTNDQKRYLSENKTFSWIGTANDYLSKLNKNLEGTQWKVEMSSKFPVAKKTEMSEVLSFDKNTIAESLKVAYETWCVPYVVDVVKSGEAGYDSPDNKRFKVVWGLPSNEIYESAAKKQQNTPYIFKMGQGVGLKNNSRTPRNNKIITRIAGYGSENNIPYGYPQIVWTGNQSWDYTINNNPSATNSYPIYDGIVGGQKVRLIKHPFTRTHLMPNVYVESVNKKVNPNATGYNPNIELKDYYDATAGGDYPNPINAQSPSYDIHEFEDIKPELGNESITAVTPLNPDLTPASSWDDTMDDDGNYIQSYFQITLPTLSFDIYACAAITESMEINMRSGACLGCTFPVEVDWEDYKANFYNEDGEFDPIIHTQEDDGHVRNGKKYPDSSNSSTPVKLILKKENTTFGTLMPNTYQHPLAGDQFVVLGISLPTSYITSAQTRLDNAMKSYMLENNVYYYDYPLKFDEAFLRNNTYILEQLKPNAIVRFEFAGQQLQLFVKQMNVKFGEGVLPKYDITLTDNIDVVLNQIGQVADDVEKLSTLISILRQSYGSNAMVELTKKLSKVDDDTAQGFIRFLKGFQVGSEFESAPFGFGKGGIFRKDADGTTYIEADKLYIRMKAYFDSVEVRRFMHSGGNRIASAAGVKCSRVAYMAWYPTDEEFVEVDKNGTYKRKDINGDEETVATGLTISYIRCFFRGEDDDTIVTNDFEIGDQAYCHVTNETLNTHHYWRLVVRTDGGTLTDDGEHWIDLSNASVEHLIINGEDYYHDGYQKTTEEGDPFVNDLPVAQDSIIQLGHICDKTRQGAIIEYTTGEDAPSYKIYQGIDDFVLNAQNYISLGYSSQTGRAYMNVYGDAYIGDPDGSTFIKYEQEDSQTHNPKMTIKAVVEFQSPDDPTQTTTLEQFASEVVGDIENIQSQIDGQIETWFYDGAPTLNNLPASQWATASEKKNHLGDLYYDNLTGYGYRFANTGTEQSPTFEWLRITDVDVVKALADAAKAQDTADHKRRVFLTQPVPPYDAGDLWSDATYPANNTEKDAGSNKYYKDLLTCKTAKAEGGSFSISDWGLTTNYTDDTKIDNLLSNEYVTLLTQGTLSEAIKNAQDAAESAQGTADAANAAAAALGYLSQALESDTQIVGGLVLSSLIGLRDANGTLWSGISGTYMEQETGTGYKGHGIAAWYGGGQVDHEVSQSASGYAKSLFRFDGSGYLAGGNITWDKDGIVTIANVYADVNGVNTSLSGSLQTLTDLSNALPLTIVSGTTYLDPQYSFKQLSVLGKAVATQEWANGKFLTIQAFERLFNALNSSGTKVSHPYSSAVASIKAMFGLWTDQYLSAKGINPQQSGGGGVGDVTWDLLASSSDTHQIALSHLTDALVNYATQSWVNNQGFLKTHQTLYTLSVYGGTTKVLSFKPNANSSLYIKAGGDISLANDTSNHYITLSYSHPTGGADTTISAASGKVLSAITVNNLGHVTSVSSKTLAEADIPDLSATYAKSSRVTTLEGYFTNGVANEAAKLSAVSKTLWGNTYWTSGGVPTSVGYDNDHKASLSYVSDIEMSGDLKMSRNGSGVRFYTDSTYGYQIVMRIWVSSNVLALGYESTLNSSYDTKIFGKTIQLGYKNSNDEIAYGLMLDSSGNVGIGTSSPSVKLDVNGYTRTSRLYLYKHATDSTKDVYLEYDNTSNRNGVHLVGAGFYSDSYVSAKGVGNSGGGSAVDMDIVWNALASNDSTHKIHNSHLSTGTLTINGNSWNPASGNGTMTIDTGDFKNITLTSNGDYDNYDKYPYSYAAYTTSSVSGLPTGLTGYYTLVSLGTGLRTFQLAAQHYGTGLKYRVLQNVNSVLSFCDWRTIWHSGNFTPSNYLLKTDISSWAKASEKPSYSFSEIDGSATASQVPNIEGLTNFSSRVYDKTAKISPNYVLAGPSSGTTTAAATFRKLVAADIPNLSWNKITSDKPTTLDGYGITDGVKNTTTWWGRSINSSGAVTGNIEVGAGDIYLNNTKAIYWKNKVDSGTATNYHCLSLNQNNLLLLGYGTAGAGYNTIVYGNNVYLRYGTARNNGVILTSSGMVGIGNTDPSVKLDVNGYTRTSRLYLYKHATDSTKDVYLEYDNTSNRNGVHLVGAGFYSDSYVSAKGIDNSGGGGSGDFIPLSGSSNIAGSLVPNANTYNLGSVSYSWNHIYAGTLHANSVTAQSVLASSGFTVSGKDNTYVLLAGGGTKLLSEIGNVRSIKVGTTSYTPTNGVVTLPAYLPLTGGAVSGSIVINYSGADFTKADNGVTSNVYPGFFVRDKNGKQTGRVFTAVNPNGKLATYLYSNNYNTDGSSVGEMYIGQEISKDGTKRWVLTDAASFRSALSLDTIYAKENYFYSGGVAKNAKQLPKGYGYDGGNGVTNPYHLMAEATASGTGSRTISAVFLVSSFYGHSRGILFVQGRIDSAGTTINTTETYAKWIVKDKDLNVSRFILTTKATSNSLTCRLYYKVTGTYRYARITLLDEHLGASTSNVWVLYSSSTDTAGDYVFASIPSDETQFVSVDNTSSKYASQLSTSCTIWGQSFNGSSNISGPLTGCTSIDSLMHFDTTNGYVGIGTSSPNYHLDVLGQIRCKNNSTDNQQLSFGCYSNSNDPYIRMTDANGSFVDALSISNAGSESSPAYVLKVGQYDRQTRIMGTNVRLYTKTSADANTYGLGLVVGYGGRVLLGSSTSLFSNNPDYRAVVDGSLYVSTNGKYDGTLDVTGATTLLSTLSVGGHITPSATATYNLGGSTLMYEYGYIRRLNTQSGYDLRIGAGGTQRIQIGASDGAVSISSAVSMASTLNVSGNTTLAGDLILANAKYVYSKNKPSSGDAININLLGLNASNEFLVGYSVGGSGYDTHIYGNAISLRYSTSRTIGFILNSSGNVSIGSTTASFITEKLNVNGNIRTSASDGAFIQIGGARIVWDNTNKALKVIQSDNSTAANFYATGAVSAKGANTASGGSGGISLNEPLTSINNSSLGSASGHVNNTFVYNGTSWVWSNSNGATLNAFALSASSISSETISCTTVTGATINGTDVSVSGKLNVGGSGNYPMYVNGNFRLGGGTGLIDVTNMNVISSQGITFKKTSSSTSLLGLDFTNNSVGIGGSNGSYKLYVSGNAKTTSNTTLCGGLEFTRDDGNAQYKITPAEEYEVRCYNTWYGTFRSSSDIRLKEIHKYHTSTTVEEISKAPVFDFSWRDDNKKRLELGTSAQYWQDVFPNAVSQMKDGYLAMDYGATALAAAVITARKVVNHEARIRLLEVENEALRNEIEQLKKVA